MALILIADQHDGFRESLASALQEVVHKVQQAGDGVSARELIQRDSPDAVIMEMDLPLRTGIDLCRDLHSDPAYEDIRVVFLASRGDETDELIGFALGADDYVTKPVGVKVLVKRLQAIFRRVGKHASNSGRTDKGIQVDHQRRLVIVNGKVIGNLTSVELNMVHAMSQHPGRVFSRAELMRAAGEIGVPSRRGETDGGRSIDARICRIRKKLGDAGRLIQTVRSVGYCLREST
jgi:two-component system phosphate regulon response regulator PhoB